MDRKTIRKYIRAAIKAGFSKDGQNTPDEWKEFIKRQFPETVDQTACSSRFGEFDQYQDYIAEGLKTNHMSRVWPGLHNLTGLKISLSSFRRYVHATMSDIKISPDMVASCDLRYSPRRMYSAKGLLLNNVPWRRCQLYELEVNGMSRGIEKTPGCRLYPGPEVLCHLQDIVRSKR